MLFLVVSLKYCFVNFTYSDMLTMQGPLPEEDMAPEWQMPTCEYSNIFIWMM